MYRFLLSPKWVASFLLCVLAAVVCVRLAHWQLDRLDLVQFHWWDYDVPRAVAVALELVSLQRAGKIRLIGLTNFDTAHVEALSAAGVPIASHQVQYSLLDDRPAHVTEAAPDDGVSAGHGSPRGRRTGRPDGTPIVSAANRCRQAASRSSR